MYTTINVKRFGFAVGLTGALLYVGCIVVMVTVGNDGTVKFLNSLLHGLDTTSIVRINTSLPEALTGIVETFVLGWLIGACIGSFYNASLFKRK